MFGRLKKLLPKKKSEEELEEHYKKLDQVELEKGDLPAMLIAAFITLVVPILLLLGAIYSLVYFLFLR